MSFSNRNQNNTTPYDHPKESNLWELHKAMEYNAGGEPSLRTLDFNLSVAQGKVPGVTGLSISGYSSSVGNTFTPAWYDGVYVYFSSAQVVRVWSESASDTNVSVLISGLDENYIQQTETVVSSNGITGVLTTKRFLRVNSIRLTRVPQNVGIIQVSGMLFLKKPASTKQKKFNSGTTFTNIYIFPTTKSTKYLFNTMDS